MKKIVVIFLMLCCHALLSQAQDIRKLFVEAPDSVLPLLPRNSRADCVDFADAGMVYPVTNLLSGKCVMKELGKSYLLLQTSGASTLEMKILPFNGSFVICVVNTVFAEAADSRIAFFDSSWNRLPAGKFFEEPAIADFFVDKENAGKSMDKCDIYLVTLKPSDANNDIVAEYTMPDYMNEDDAAEVRPLLKKITYRWNGKRFVRV